MFEWFLFPLNVEDGSVLFCFETPFTFCALTNFQPSDLLDDDMLSVLCVHRVVQFGIGLTGGTQ